MPYECIFFGNTEHLPQAAGKIAARGVGRTYEVN
jgi:hypothetical protein